MVFSDDKNPSVSSAQERESEEQTALTPGWENAATHPVVPSRSLQPFARHRRLFRFTGILLVILLIFTLVRLSTIWIGADDQLLVRIGNQQTAIVDLRQGFPISPYLFGATVFPEMNTHSVDQEFTGFMNYSPPIANGLQNARIKLLRFPGGNWGEKHLLSYAQLNDFSTLLSQIGAEGMVQARLSGPVGHSGTYVALLLNRANLAGRWVDYMNNLHSDQRTGKYAHAPFHPIKFWTVGNEPDRLLNPDTGKPFTVAEYVNDFIQFSTAMHQNDPAIQVFGPELSQFYGVGVGPTDPNGQLWMEGFLKGVGTYEKAHPELKFHLLDGVSFHFYPLANASKASATLLSSADEWNYLLPPLRQLIRQDFGRDAPIAVTEINSNSTTQVLSRGLTALWWADTLGTLMEQEVEYVAFFSAEGLDIPYPLFTSDGLHQTPMFRVMQLFSHLQPNLIAVAAQHDPISIYATQDDTHLAVSLLFVNKSAMTQLVQVSAQNQSFGMSAWHNLDISLSAYSITLVTLHRAGGAEAYSYKVPAIDDANVAPLTYTVCGHRTDVLANVAPC